MFEENGKDVPDEIRGWNWGAFMFNWVWGIGNKTYLPLLVFIPVFNIVWIFIVGARGNYWAWQNGNYKDIETFKAVQATWNRAGLVQFIFVIVEIFLYTTFMAFIMFAIFASYFNFYYGN